MRQLLLAPLAAALLLAGCATAPPELPAQPPAPSRFKDDGPRWTVAAPAESQDRGMWWKSFADPTLDRLVEQAAQRNTSVQEAGEPTPWASGPLPIS